MGAEFIVWYKPARIRFRRPGRSALFATFELQPELLAGLQEELAHAPLVDRVFTVELREAGMTTSSGTPDAEDPYDLSRFVRAQEGDYERALSEIMDGRKRSHWMWYIFPQIDGLAFSSTSRHFAIKGIEEAGAFLAHPVLGPRLLKCAEAVLAVEGRTAGEIFGSPDDLKLRSCATLFASLLPPGSVFDRLIAKYYGGVRDDRTLQRLAGP